MLKKCQQILIDNRSSCASNVTCYGTLPGGNLFAQPRFEFHAPCIQALSSPEKHSGSKALFIWHLPSKKVDDKIVSRYLRWVVGDESPWRIIVNAQPEQDIEFIFQNGYVFTDLDLPANLVANFMTAFRLCQERPDLAELWHQLVQDGVSPGAAISTCGLIQGYKKETQVGTFCNYSWHFAFGNEFLDSESVSRINDGNPRRERMSHWMFSRDTNYIPCNTIWGKGGKGYKGLIDFSSNFKNEVKSNRMFSDPEVRGYTPAASGRYEVLLAFARALDDKKIAL